MNHSDKAHVVVPGNPPELVSVPVRPCFNGFWQYLGAGSIVGTITFFILSVPLFFVVGPFVILLVLVIPLTALTSPIWFDRFVVIRCPYCRGEVVTERGSSRSVRCRICSNVIARIIW